MPGPAEKIFVDSRMLWRSTATTPDTEIDSGGGSGLESGQLTRIPFIKAPSIVPIRRGWRGLFLLPMSMTDAAGVIKFLPINKASSGSSLIVPAVTSKRLRVLGLVLNNSGSPTTVTVEDEDGNDVIGPIYLVQGATVVLPTNGIGYGDADTGKALHLNSAAAVQIGGAIAYQETPGG